MMMSSALLNGACLVAFLACFSGGVNFVTGATGVRQAANGQWLHLRPHSGVFDLAAGASESSVSFDEDDEADDGDGDGDSELNTAATQEFPETDATNAFNEDGAGFGEADGDGDNYGDSLAAASSVEEQVPTMVGRRVKRDTDDRLIQLRRQLLAESRKQQRRHRKSERPKGTKEADEAAEEAEIDSWVHDGVDDIQIDPETRRAASQLASDEKSIDAEYEGAAPARNRTRITTIAEVITPAMAADDEEPQQHPFAGSEQSGKRGANSVLSSRVVQAPHSQLVPAGYLSLDQVMQLVGGRGSSGAAAAAELVRPLSRAAPDELGDWTAEGGSEPSTSDWSEPSSA